MLSFPSLNPEVLAKVYSIINTFYAKDEAEWFKSYGDDEKLLSLVKSGNFNKLYTKVLSETKAIIKTPERTEDIHGQWFEYNPGDEVELAQTAEGTRWRIADPYAGRNYLTTGEYNDSEPVRPEDNKAKFFIFRLEASQSLTGYADNGCASVRLDTDGNVAEVSGLGEDQAIEDSLVPIVEAKTMSLPGGKEYLVKFADKHTLIRLDHKMKANQDLTKDEIEFLYEFNRPITNLNTYGVDQRINELRDKYNVNYVLSHNEQLGIDVDKLASRLTPYTIAKNLDILIEHGANIE